MEIQQIFEREALLKISIPIPSYIFVQRYGREIGEDIEEIAKLFGRKTWFTFDSGSIKKEEKLLTAFKIELERHSGIGKEYTGCILVELSGKESENDLEELFGYIDTQKHRLQCIYTIKEAEAVFGIKIQLENFGFVRVIEGEEYDALEQMEIFQNTLKTYQFQLETAAKQYIEDFFEKQKWQESDMVKVRIQNMAKEIVYKKLIEKDTTDYWVTKEEAKKVLSSLQEKTPQKRQIGFVMGGAEL